MEENLSVTNFMICVKSLAWKLQLFLHIVRTLSNDLCKHHNQYLPNMFDKILEDTKCDYDTALKWAVSPKKALIKNGFSPTQLVFRAKF